MIREKKVASIGGSSPMSRGMETTIVGQMLWGWKRWVKQGWPYVSSRHVQNKRGRPKFKSKAAKHIQNISATQNVPAMYLHLTSRLSHLPCMLKRKDLTKKKQKTHTTFSQKFLSGFSVSMVWILRTSRRGWASLFVQAWRDIFEASWGFTVIFEGEPPSNSALGREPPVKVMIVMVLLPQ